ncbi:ADP-ribose pyrophosphatase YjhB, NUDIX family [Raineyella antarctica]|uniref:ADP-ribose pyrophosphatase YjhB, NUDIX family n=1 Tax=Raineyella antarctica TaxID=1577474 RepID=A0A1G6GDL1_9ACTN|nr:ADP-ribose pyrophosphatase YjhB, NUDIX family [Raineyella antarctica]
MFGAAGLLVWRSSGNGHQVVLQHRADWTHHGGTWGIPGGALSGTESSIDGALREAVEEAGLVTSAVQVRADRTLVHPNWSYTTVVAEAIAPWQPAVTDAESHEVRWIDLAEVEQLPLLPAFAAALPELRTMLGRLVVVVDAANVVGSRPDGWWSDRRGATAGLRDHLAELAGTGLPADAVGLPGGTWYPEFVLVTEGAARGIEPAEGVRVVTAAGSGDDAVVAAVAEQADAPGTLLRVATADRELGSRVASFGAEMISPRLVRH